MSPNKRFTRYISGIWLLPLGHCRQLESFSIWDHIKTNLIAQNKRPEPKGSSMATGVNLDFTEGEDPSIRMRVWGLQRQSPQMGCRPAGVEPTTAWHTIDPLKKVERISNVSRRIWSQYIPEHITKAIKQFFHSGSRDEKPPIIHKMMISSACHSAWRPLHTTFQPHLVITILLSYLSLDSNSCVPSYFPHFSTQLHSLYKTLLLCM